MSELLEEARERRDKAELSTESPSYNWLNDSYYLGEQNAWREAVDLIEKHEKPMELIDVIGEWEDMKKSMATVDDNVNHPDHYTQGDIETIDYIKDKLTDEEFRGFVKGNVLKYVSREGLKNGDEDLKKSDWYLNKLIEVLE
ncbi:DUF3310 domain-containing protein [Tetragenococcus halophilus]|uniref:DUF3310 domain-containing protein n=1 Tax=Tetragenococcus halophilus TaxID=51669 RepID=UPI0030C979E1